MKSASDGRCALRWNTLAAALLAAAAVLWAAAGGVPAKAQAQDVCVNLLLEHCIDPPPVPPTPNPSDPPQDVCVNLLMNECVDTRVVVPCAAADTQSLKTGDLITDVGVEIPVPPPGQSLHGSVYGVIGSDELDVSTEPSGRVRVDDCGNDEPPPSENPNDPPPSSGDPPPPENNPPPAGADPSRDAQEDKNAGAPRACKDRAFNTAGYRWTTPLAWRFNVGSTPSGITGAQEEIFQGGESIVQARNSCGLVDDIDAAQRYDGTTAARANIEDGRQNAAKLRCEPADSESVVDFGNLPKFAVAGACTASFANNPQQAAVSDVRLNKNDYRFTTDPNSSSCANAYSIRGVMAHERGHSFGLDHVGEEEHGNLTMSKFLNGPCQDSEYRLGFGDVRGLRRAGY